MNFLQRLSSKAAVPSDAYGSISTMEENATTSPQVDSLQDADNFKFGTGSSHAPAVVIKDKLKGSPFLADMPSDLPPASPSMIKASNSIASNTGNLFSSWSAAGQNALAAITKKDTASTSKDSEPEPTDGKLMGEININWNYVTPTEPRTSANGEDGMSDAERLKQTKQVLEEEVCLVKLGLFGVHSVLCCATLQSTMVCVVTMISKIKATFLCLPSELVVPDPSVFAQQGVLLHELCSLH